jgi:hypothetical protein
MNRIGVHLVALLLAVAVPVAGHWRRAHRGPRCAYDGGTVDPRYQVRITGPAGETLSFCCVRCADDWLLHQDGGPFRVRVTDEAGGEELDAAEAVFVRSPIVTRSSTQNRVHVFKSQQDAARHCALAGGTLLSGSERPLLTPAERAPRKEP